MAAETPKTTTGETTETDLRTFRDFLMQYNSVTEKCFTSCVQDLTSRNVSEKEERCAKNCLDKFLKMTQRLSMRFQEHQLIQTEAQGGTVLMACSSLASLCEAILEDYFGFYVSSVGSALLSQDLTLIELRKKLRDKCRMSDICRSIAIMELHGLISFALTKWGVIYTIDVENVLHLAQLSQAVSIVKKLYGDLCGNIINELAFQGRSTYEKCVSAFSESASEKECHESFTLLAQCQIIRKCDLIISTEGGFPVTQKHGQPFEFKEKLDVKPSENGSRKRRRESESSSSDLWCINWQQMERYFLNKLILNLVRNHKDYNSEDEHLWQSLLLVAESRFNTSKSISDPISISEVCRHLKDNYMNSISWEKANAVLTKFSQSNESTHSTSTIIRKTGETAGGLYNINYMSAIEMFCNEHVESVIRARIDDRAVRIFRLLRLHRNIEEDLLPKMAMLKPEEAKEICYLMLENGYIFVRPISRANDFSANRAVYFYSYKLAELLVKMLRLSYDSLRNAILRRQHEKKKNKVLLDSWRKIETIVTTINSNDEMSKADKLAQASEVESMYMTEEDKRNFQRHIRNQKQMLMTEIGISQTLFVFKLGWMFNKHTSLMEAAQKTKRKRGTVLDF